MAKLLFVTSLYPDDERQSRLEKTFAIHDFVKHWKDDTVIVLKPFKIGAFSFLRYSRVYETSTEGIPIIHVPTVPGKLTFPFLSGVFYRRALRIAKSMKPDVIVSHYRINHIFASDLARKLKIPHVAGIHHTCFKFMSEASVNPVGRLILRAVMRSDLILCRSPLLARKTAALLNAEGIEREIGEISSGISANRILGELRFLEKARRSGSLRIVTVATLKARKNVAACVEAVARLGNIIESYTIVGGGLEYGNLNALAESLSVSPIVTFTGQVEPDAVYQYLDAADVFILPSSNETFGLVYLEAMARGCLVVGLRNDGIDGIILDGGNGFLCDTPDPSDIMKVLGRIAALNAHEREMIAVNARETILSRTDENASNRYRSYLAQILCREITA